ncbi:MULTISPECIES: SPOR domain-containing protein [Kocuria]|uniref:SPOR domain-containing protein n=1 Tax=Kocuria subflava TaxID=1736139 RepID=A0A846TQ04_9MICC|nr:MULTISPECIES: SPOR domain-containing protein [Kocuria]NKE08899.1 SPOR domain-containing protein [Kocuria subflava]
MEFWYNLKTREVEVGPQSDYSQLMGPYASREDAQRALQTAAENTKRWDDNEREYRQDD